MALRTPSRYTPRWYYEDKLEYVIENPSTTFYEYDYDFQIPPNYFVFDTELNMEGFYVKSPSQRLYKEFRTLTIKLWDEDDIPTRRRDTFNNEVAYIEYEVDQNLITITNWQHTWRDEWPIRLGFQYLRNCRNKPGQGTVFRVEKNPLPFWVSEGFLPVTGHADPYLQTVPLWVP